MSQETPESDVDRVDRARPILKWAGGKTQLLPNLLPMIPKRFGRYIEPFVGGGALFFALSHHPSLIADTNPELINLYRAVAHDLDSVLDCLRGRESSADEFYRMRAVDWRAISASEAAARTIFLNKTCFNGLYRVNRQGEFNVPFGKSSGPIAWNEPNLRAASKLLQHAEIVEEDFRSVLATRPKPGDLVFLDPPYLPISASSDFKRYTPLQFNEEDHAALAREVDRLASIGCHVILTNSNHPLVYDLFGHHQIEVIETRRQINSNSSNRRGQDLIVYAAPESGSTIAGDDRERRSA